MSSTTLSTQDRELLEANGLRGRQLLAELGPGALRGLVEDIVEANAEVLDTDNPSHVDSGTLPSAGGDVQQDSVADPEGKPKAIVGLFVGHNRGTGATAIDGADEWESRRKVANAAAEKLKDAGYRAHVIYRNGRLGYASAMREHGRATSSLRLDLALELHFNAFDGSAEGAEILVASQSTADTLGKAFVDATSAAYPDRVLRSGGVKLQTGGRGYLFNANQRCPSGVYEPCFGDSPEWEDYVNDVDKEAEYVADIVRRFNEEGS